jgi:D-amino-acid dehydrogenase
MTPDGTPVVGPTEIAGLYLSTGHRTLGWTMSTGSARVVSDLVSGRVPEIDVAGLAISSYGRTVSPVITENLVPSKSI